MPTAPEQVEAVHTSREAKLARLAQLDELETRRCEQSLSQFVKSAWHVLESSQKLVWNWHLDLLCGELEDISFGRTNADVCINQPPGSMKSYILIFWNAWEWGPRHRAHMRWLCASHAQHLSSRDNQRVRDLIQSEWFQARWPHVQLREDQNQKTQFSTTDGGWRIGTSVGAQAALGEHPHVKVIDDAHDPENVPGELERDSVWHWFTQTMSQRGQALNAVTVAVGQRLHEDDIFGRIAIKLFGWTRIVLPMRYEPPAIVNGVLTERMPPTPSGRCDQRTTRGELLWPEHLTEMVVKKSEAVLGGPSSEGVAAQHQQSPMAPGGNMFQRSWFRVIGTFPTNIVRWVRFWDIAGTEGGTGSRTAGIKMGETATGRYVISGDLVVGRWGESEVETRMVQTAALDGVSVAIREEQEPGSSGKAVVLARARKLPGYDYDGVPTSGDKMTRAKPLRTQAEAGNVDIVARTEAERILVEDFLQEFSLFPRGTLKDQVDATAGAFNALVTIASQPQQEAPKVGGVWGGARKPGTQASATIPMTPLQRSM